MVNQVLKSESQVCDVIVEPSVEAFLPTVIDVQLPVSMSLCPISPNVRAKRQMVIVRILFIDYLFF